MEKETLTLLEKIERDYLPASLSSSFGAEDMVLTDMIARHFPSIEIFTLDTGRLHEETYALMQKVREHYGIPVKSYFPRYDLVEQYLLENGPNGFYKSIELRKACCHMRKVEPLQRALRGKKAWVTGIRAQQSSSRQDIDHSFFDADFNVHKFNPLLKWKEPDVWAYIAKHNVPYNPLHEKGFPSIGCEPCTRAIAKGEDIRAGRWWWEEESTKECGLHAKRKS